MQSTDLVKGELIQTWTLTVVEEKLQIMRSSRLLVVIRRVLVLD